MTQTLSLTAIIGIGVIILTGGMYAIGGLGWLAEKSKWLAWLLFLGGMFLTAWFVRDPCIAHSFWLYVVLFLYGVYSYVITRASGDIAYEDELKARIQELEERLEEYDDG